MDHGENCFPFLTSLFSRKRLRQLGALAEDICLYEILQHTPVSWHAWERRRHMALDLLSHQRCSLSPPWGRAITFFMLEHTGDLGPYFLPFLFFFFWCWSKLFLLLLVEWFSSVTSASDTTQLPKTGHGRKANWQENRHVTLKIKTKIEILALSLLLVFQQCYCASGLHATRWNRQCIF